MEVIHIPFHLVCYLLFELQLHFLVLRLGLGIIFIHLLIGVAIFYVCVKMAWRKALVWYHTWRAQIIKRKIELLKKEMQLLKGGMEKMEIH